MTTGVVYVPGGWAYAVQNCMGGYEVYDYIVRAFPKLKAPREPIGKFWKVYRTPPNRPSPVSLADFKAVGDSVPDWPVCTLYTLDVPWKALPEKAQAQFLRVRNSFLGDGPINREVLANMFDEWVEKKRYALKGLPDSPMAQANMFAGMFGLQEARIERAIPKSWIKDCYRVPAQSFVWR